MYKAIFIWKQTLPPKQSHDQVNNISQNQPKHTDKNSQIENRHKSINIPGGDWNDHFRIVNNWIKNQA